MQSFNRVLQSSDVSLAWAALSILQSPSSSPRFPRGSGGHGLQKPKALPCFPPAVWRQPKQALTLQVGFNMPSVHETAANHEPHASPSVSLKPLPGRAESTSPNPPSRPMSPESLAYLPCTLTPSTDVSDMPESDAALRACIEAELRRKSERAKRKAKGGCGGAREMLLMLEEADAKERIACVERSTVRLTSS